MIKASHPKSFLNPLNQRYFSDLFSLKKKKISDYQTSHSIQIKFYEIVTLIFQE